MSKVVLVVHACTCIRREKISVMERPFTRQRETKIFLRNAFLKLRYIIRNFAKYHDTTVYLNATLTTQKYVKPYY